MRLRDLLLDVRRRTPNSVLTARVETTDATVTTLATITLEDNSTYQIVADVVARRTGGASGTAGDGASYRRIGTFTRVSAGGATLVGSLSTPHTAENQSGWDCTLSVSGNDVLVRTTGASGNNVSWFGIVSIQRV